MTLSRKIKNTIRNILSLPVYKTRDEINAIEIIDNGESMFEVFETEKIRINRDPKTSMRKSMFDAITSHALREQVHARLVQASKNLPHGYSFMILETFRPYAIQLERFDAKYAKLRSEFPVSISDEEVKRRTRLGVADPREGAPHQTGSAVDLTIIGPDGNPLDMGTVWAEFNEKTPTKNWHRVTRAQMKNRRMLVRAMESAGFVNYPGEWWHYSYGDRAWAAYAGKKHAVYGSVKENDRQG